MVYLLLEHGYEKMFFVLFLQIHLRALANRINNTIKAILCSFITNTDCTTALKFKSSVSQNLDILKIKTVYNRSVNFFKFVLFKSTKQHFHFTTKIGWELVVAQYHPICFIVSIKVFNLCFPYSNPTIWLLNHTAMEQYRTTLNIVKYMHACVHTHACTHTHAHTHTLSC